MRSAICTREIYWKGKTYRSGDIIKITKEDAYILFNAGVIGNVKEFAVREAPENAMKMHRGKRKPS
jgi:S1-C subfamily serine protease